MAGFREFVTGEVLTAANVDDFLAKQAVMKFADAAARNTALGTAVGGSNALREGMVAYLDDTNTPQYYDGSSWTDFSPSSLDASVITSGVFDAARIPDVANAGIGSNVVEDTLTTQFSTTSSSFVNVTGLVASITPSAATSKVLVLAHFAATQTESGADTLFDITATSGGNISNVAQATIGTSYLRSSQSCVRLHSPATTSSVTYQVRMKRTGGGTGRVSETTAYSSIVLIEVAV